MNKSPRLGRGLATLLGPQAHFNNLDLDTPDQLIYLEIESLEPDLTQPRNIFNTESINELADSIKHNGIINPIVVTRQETGKYLIIAGERRWRAAKIAGLSLVPVIIRKLTNKEAREIALVENIQREDLTPLEEAEGYKQLLEDCGYTQEELARTVGRSRSYIANILRLNNLPNVVKQQLQNRAISAGHARALITDEDPVELMELIIAKGLNVRQTESLVKSRSIKSLKNKKEQQELQQSEHEQQELKNIAELLSQKFLTNIELAKVKGNQYKLVWDIESLDKLDEILQQLH